MVKLLINEEGKRTFSIPFCECVCGAALIMHLTRYNIEVSATVCTSSHTEPQRWIVFYPIQTQIVDVCKEWIAQISSINKGSESEY